jgi:hypothetical protein
MPGRWHRTQDGCEAFVIGLVLEGLLQPTVMGFHGEDRIAVVPDAARFPLCSVIGLFCLIQREPFKG